MALSEDARELLSVAAQSPNGEIRNLGGRISSGGRRFSTIREPRSRARWSHALEELESKGLVKAHNRARQIFRVTHTGYGVYDGQENM